MEVTVDGLLLAGKPFHQILLCPSLEFGEKPQAEKGHGRIKVTGQSGRCMVVNGC